METYAVAILMAVVPATMHMQLVPNEAGYPVIRKETI